MSIIYISDQNRDTSRNVSWSAGNTTVIKLTRRKILAVLQFETDRLPDLSGKKSLKFEYFVAY